MKKKSETPAKIIELAKHLRASENVTVKNIRCDNAGENKALSKLCLSKGLGITFQFTAPNTPQQNGAIEQSFAMSYGRMRANLNAAGIRGELRQRLWAEAANYENDTKNFMVTRKTDMSSHERFFN